MYQKISGSEKFYASERGEGVSRFSVEKFWSHSAENFRKGESFSVSLILGIEKFYASEGYVTIFDFLSNFFVSHCQKISWYPFKVLENMGYRKILCIIGGITSFRQRFFVPQCRKTS